MSPERRIHFEDDWPARVVAELLCAREIGLDFDDAWSHAMRVCGLRKRLPPRSKGGARFPTEPFDEFFRRVCRREWEGEVTADYAGIAELLYDPPDPTPGVTRRTDRRERVGLIA